MFKNEYIMNRELIKEYVLKILCKDIFILGIILIIFSGIMFLLEEPSYTGATIVLFTLFLTIFFPMILIKNMEDNSKRLNNGKIEKTEVVFDDNIIMNEGKVHLEFEYSQIKKIKQTKNFIVLMIGSKSAILVFKNGFTKGSKDEFLKFISSKVNFEVK